MQIWPPKTLLTQQEAFRQVVCSPDAKLAPQRRTWVCVWHSTHPHTLTGDVSRQGQPAVLLLPLLVPITLLFFFLTAAGGRRGKGQGAQSHGSSVQDGVFVGHCTCSVLGKLRHRRWQNQLVLRVLLHAGCL